METKPSEPEYLDFPAPRGEGGGGEGGISVEGVAQEQCHAILVVMEFFVLLHGFPDFWERMTGFKIFMKDII